MPYRPVSLNRTAESIPGLLKRLQIRALIPLRIWLKDLFMPNLHSSLLRVAIFISSGLSVLVQSLTKKFKCVKIKIAVRFCNITSKGSYLCTLKSKKVSIGNYIPYAMTYEIYFNLIWLVMYIAY